MTSLLLLLLSRFSHALLCATYGLQPARLLCPWEFSRQEFYSGLPRPPPEDLPDPDIEAGLLHCRQILYP